MDDVVTDSAVVFRFERTNEGVWQSGAGGSDAWLHLDSTQGDCSELLRNRGVPEDVIEALVRSEQRPRVVARGESVLLVLRAVNLNPGAAVEDMVSLRLWLTPQGLFTVRQRRLLSVQDVRAEIEAGWQPTSATDIVLRVLDRVVDRIAETVDAVEADLATLEQGRADVSAITELRNRAASLRRYLAPMRDTLATVPVQAAQQFDEDAAFELREQSDRLARFVEDLDLVRERLLGLREEHLAELSQIQNSRMYVLAIVTAVFLPLSFLTGVFGMNVAGLPGTETSSAFAWVAGSMAVIAVLALLAFKRKGWF